MVDGGRVYGQMNRLVLSCWWLEGGWAANYLWDDWRGSVGEPLWGVVREENAGRLVAVAWSLLYLLVHAGGNWSIVLAHMMGTNIFELENEHRLP